MCGIAATRDLGQPYRPSALHREQLKAELLASVTAISHRGPDSVGTYVSEDGQVAMAHTRLSIIDLEGGQQPLHDSEADIHAVVAGELYDYRELRKDLESKGCHFKSHVDSELVLHLYRIHGQNMFRYLRGEFSFILYDGKRQLFLVARDRFGMKPLYYTVVESRILVASEIKAFLPLGLKPEWDVESIIEMGEYFDDRTVFKGVYKLPAAHFLTCTHGGRLQVQRYWEHCYPPSQTLESRTVDEMIEGVRTRLIESIRVRLRSEVPLAILLSGGLDSSAVAGITASIVKEQGIETHQLATFVLSFPDRPAQDEGPTAARTAEFIGAKIHQVTPSEQDLISYFDKSVYHCEGPVMGLQAAGLVILSEKVREQGYRVVLNGQGSDEIFGGYQYFLQDFLSAVDTSALQIKGILVPPANELARMKTAVTKQNFWSKHVAMSDIALDSNGEEINAVPGLGLLGSTSPPSEVFLPGVVQKWGAPSVSRTAARGMSLLAKNKAISGDWHPFHVSQYIHSTTILSNGLLNWLGDRVEMANSVEGRLPFLDHNVVEYVDHLPPSVKIRPTPAPESSSLPLNFTEKWILREAVKPYITSEVYQRKKVPYNTPLPPRSGLVDEDSVSATSKSISTRNWTPLQAYLKEKLTRDSMDQLGWANTEYMLGLLQDYLDHPEDNANGGVGRRARILLYIASFTILQDKFGVPKATI